MFTIKGRLKVTLLVSVFLAVGLGMYVVFHADESYAHGLNPVQDTKRDVTTTTVTTEMPSTQDCPACGEQRTKTYRRREIEEIFTTTHFHLSISLQWVHQYSYTYTRNTTKEDNYWSACPNSQCGG